MGFKRTGILGDMLLDDSKGLRYQEHGRTRGYQDHRRQLKVILSMAPAIFSVVRIRSLFGLPDTFVI